MRAKLEMGTVLALMTLVAWSSHASAAPREIEDICFSKAAKRSFNGRGEREQFIANCVADLTPASTKERRRYKKAPALSGVTPYGVGA